MKNEQELLFLAANGDEAAFTHLFQSYANHIYSIGFKFSDSQAMAEETVQEVFLKIWLRREILAEVRDFKAYLFIVARNYLYKSLRQNARKYKKLAELSYSIPSEKNDVESALLEKEYGLVLEDAINRLPGQQKKVYELVKILGFKREEAARLLKIHPETIKYHLAEAMKNIRRNCLPYLELFLIINCSISIF